MVDPITHVAQAAAKRLAADHGPGLASDVEAALLSRVAVHRKGQYVDPASLGSLIVTAATLAWAVYSDLQSEMPFPPKDVMIRIVNIEFQDYGRSSTVDRNVIVNIVVDEVARSANQIF